MGDTFGGDGDPLKPENPCGHLFIRDSMVDLLSRINDLGSAPEKLGEIAVSFKVIVYMMCVYWDIKRNMNYVHV